jgi:predicted RNA binding protein YcfA (HicA-like mRNA interferase family)
VSPDGRTLRNVRIERAIRAFEKLGYRTARVRGSHHVLTHPERGVLVLPFHRGTVKTGILLDALKKAGISVQEFQELL